MKKIFAGLVVTGLVVAAVSFAQEGKSSTYTLVVNGSK
jgi:hypothetical protein